jgi:hypothetical protein
MIFPGHNFSVVPRSQQSVVIEKLTQRKAITGHEAAAVQVNAQAVRLCRFFETMLHNVGRDYVMGVL